MAATGVLITIGLIWCLIFFFVKIAPEEPEYPDLSEAQFMKGTSYEAFQETQTNQAFKIYRGPTRADYDFEAAVLGLEYMEGESLVDLMHRIENFKKGEADEKTVH